MSSVLVAAEQVLLTGKWNENLQNDTPLFEQTRSVVNGSFRDVLISPESRNIFKLRSSVTDKDFLDRNLDEWFDFSISPQDDIASQEWLRILIGVALLHAFVQANWTGPNVDVAPLDILTIPSEYRDDVTEEYLHRKAVAELAYGGEPVYHLASLPLFLRLAQLIFDLPYQHCQSAAWWRLRTWLIHQQVLDEPVAVPAEVQLSLQSLPDSIISDPELRGRLSVEEGLLQHFLSNDKVAAELFVRAARQTQLEFELTGAPGKRTKFIERDITQLVLLAQSHLTVDDDGSKAADTSNSPERAKNDPVIPGIPVPTASVMPETLALNDDTLLEQTQFTSSNPAASDSHLAHLDPTSQPALHPIDQCILLALCLNIKNTSPVHGLTAEQMAPYVARVISHPRNWSVHTMALLLRSRLEANRTKTVERSALQLQALVDQMPTADSTIAERLLYIHSLPLPSKWEMEKELAMRFLSIGVVKSALEIFERLEMWEQVVSCWQSLERRDKGIAVVRDLLQGKKAEAETVISRGKANTDSRRQTLDSAREAKLWCLLGDLEPDHALEHYTHAWELSKGTSGRAMRSLGGVYFARGDYPHTIECLRKAVAINPLLSRSWFILGCAYIRVENWEGARDSFSRCVSIDDEDGESWNNLASVYLRMGEAGQKANVGEHDGKPEEASDQSQERDEDQNKIPFTNRILAFRALKQGLKFKYDNWRMWANYMVVAMDVGELLEACRALGRVVEERSAKEGAGCVDEDVLDRLVNAITRTPLMTNDPGQDSQNTPGHASANPNVGHGLLKQVSDLLDRIILPRVSSSRIFRAKARLLTWEERWEDALNTYLDAYRSGVAGTMEKGETDIERWRQGVGEVEEIVDVLRNFGPRVDGFAWRLQARSIVRTFMARTRDFEDEPEWSRLQGLQEEVRKE